MNVNPSTAVLQNQQNQLLAISDSMDLLHKKFIESALKLDASILEPFIPEDMLLQDLSKYRFLDTLSYLFETIWHQYPEDWRVELADFTCKYCQHGKPLASFEVFTGVEFMPFAKFAYFVETNSSGETTDIYICDGFMKTPDFKQRFKV